MKITSLITKTLLATLSSITVSAQSSYFTVKESEEFKDKKRTTSVLAVHTTEDDHTVLARSIKKGLVFDIFDSSANIIYNRVEEVDKKEKFMGELFYGNELKVFTVYSPKKNERILYCHVLNLKGSKYEKIELLSTTVEKKQQWFSGQNKRQTNLAFSPDERYLAIATDNIKKHSNSYLVNVFDAKTLELLYTKTFYENKKRYFVSTDMMVDNEGNVYALGKQYFEGRAEKKNGIANYEFVLTKVNRDYAESESIALDGDQHIASLRIVEREDEFYLMGFYSEDNAGRIKGVSLFKLDKDYLEVQDVKNMALPKQVYEDLYGYRRAKKKGKKELRSFYLDHFIEDSQGNIYLVAEEFYVTQQYHSYGTNGHGQWVTVYHYDDILIIRVGTGGNIEWGRSIFKRAGTPSYNTFVMDNKLHILLNSGKSLIEKKDGRTKVSQGFLESSSLYDFVYGPSGKNQIEKIQDNKGRTTYIPYLGNYKNGKFVMLNESKANKQLMVLEGK